MNKKDLELNEQRKVLVDSKYPQRESVLSRNAYLECRQVRRRNLYLSYIGGLGCCLLPKMKNKFRAFFLGSFLTFSVLDFINDYNFQNVTEEINRRAAKKYNMMMDLK